MKPAASQTMKSEPLYYVILYRPEGSKTLTPVTDVDARKYAPQGNYFGSEERAYDVIGRMQLDGFSCYLPGPQKVAGAVLTVGAVILPEDRSEYVSHPLHIPYPADAGDLAA
jgi:hypothetical protein